MIEADMLEAAATLGRLVEAAERGEQVFLKRDGVPVVEIVAIRSSDFPFGFLSGQAGGIDDSLLFNSSDEELTTSYGYDDHVRPPYDV